MKKAVYFTSSLILAALILLASCNDTSQKKKKEHMEKKSHSFISEVKHPDWSKNATLYEVNVRQYTEEGTLKAVQEHLPRLKELGVDILWLMPVYPVGEKNKKGQLGSVYAVKDFKAINPNYGTMEDFMELLNRAHEMGFHVLMDWVPNHTAWDNHLIEEHPEWYVKDESGSPKRPDDFDWTDVAQLDWSYEGLQDYMLEALTFWVNLGVDGFRVDQPQNTPKEFWENARFELEKIRPVLLLAENEDKYYLMEKGFDMNYSWELHHLMNRVAQGKDTVSNIVHLLEKDYQTFPPNVYRTRFISNHDENTHQGPLPERMGEATGAFAVLMFTIPGFPLLYSGQEACLDKALKEFVRDPIEWRECEMTGFYKHLIALKKKNEVLWNGEFGGDLEFLQTNNDKVIAYCREKNNNSILVILNLSDVKQEFFISTGEKNGNYQDAFTGKDFIFNESKNLELDAWNYLVLINN